MPLTHAGAGGAPGDQEVHETLVRLGLWPPAAIIVSAASAVILVCVAGAATVVVSTATQGRRCPAKQAWALTQRRVPALIGLWATGVAVSTVVTCALVLFAIAAAVIVGPGVGRGVGVALTVASGAIAILTRPTVGLSAPVVIMEGRGPWSALGRAVALQRHDYWRPVRYTFVVDILSLVLGAALWGPFLAVAAAVRPGTEAVEQTVPSLLFAAAGWALWQIITLPLRIAFDTVLYQDLRDRFERRREWHKYGKSPAYGPGSLRSDAR